MKSFLPLLSLVIVFGSCTTAYKSGQTPDDVYFSPTPKKEYTDQEEKKEEAREDKKDENNYAYEDDRYLRMKVRNRDRWSYLDDYYRDPNAYSYNRTYYYNDNCCCNPRTYWNHYYNPYNTRVVYVNPRTPLYSKPRTYNLHVFDTPANAGTKSRTNTSRTYANPRDTRPASNTGNVLRDVFRGSTDNSSSSNNNSSSSSNTKTSSSSSSSNSSSSGSTNAPARKF